MAEFEIHIGSSVLFGSKVSAVLGHTWGSFASDFMERREGKVLTRERLQVCRWVKFRSLPASAEKVKKFFSLLVCGIAHQ